jgi:hypothetical protein
MSGVFRNIDPPPPHRPASVYPPPPSPLVRGEDPLAVWRGGGGTPDTALYSKSVSTLCKYHSENLIRTCRPALQGQCHGIFASRRKI